MESLDTLREEIEKTDAELAKLFCRRMRLSGGVAEYKKQHGLPVYDPVREAALLKKEVAGLEDPAFARYYTLFLQNLMALSRQHQNNVLGTGRVAYQGTEGGFGHAVAKALYPAAQLGALPTFRDVFTAVEKGDVGYGVVPFENSNTGDVTGVLDLLFTHSCSIVHMYDLPVTQNLLALPGATLADIKTAYSKQEALEQSRKFLETAGIAMQEYGNTATAAQYVAEKGDKSLAAVASLEAAGRYGLVPLAKDIATETDNTTRFIVIARQPAAHGDRFSLLLTVENTVGSLEKALRAVSDEGLNMESIKSRPMPKRPWEYYFFIELVGTPKHEDVPALLKRIEKACLSARMLGSYTRTGPQPPAGQGGAV